MSVEITILAFAAAFTGGLALFAGGVLAFVFKKISQNLIAGILGFTAGVMLYAAFLRFLPSCRVLLELNHSIEKSTWIMTIAFFAGILATLPIDLVLEIRQKKLNRNHVNIRQTSEGFKELTLLIFLSITIHNFVEGLATYLSFLSNPQLAIPVVLSIAAHNIPEGILIGMTVFKISKDKKLSLLICLLSGLADPLGALVGMLIIEPIYSLSIEGVIRAFLAGLLVNTALDELIPGSEFRGNHTISIRSIVGGMLFMAIIIIIFH